VLIASIICLVFAVLGEAILRLFGVSIPAFQIGGGIIVLLLSLDMVVGKSESDNGTDGSAEKRSEPPLKIATYPLAFPLMASVSGLAAIVSLLAQRDDLKALLFLTVVIVAIMTINYFCLRACRLIVRAMGPTALQVAGRLMGVILTSLVVELILMGLIGLGIIAKHAARTAGEVSLPRTVTTSFGACPIRADPPTVFVDARPNTNPAPNIQPQRTATPTPIAVATAICAIAPERAILRTSHKSRMEKCIPTPNISKMTPISASCWARCTSSTNPGVNDPMATPASR
jgi:multiple antibiotic resistance protein